jgi:hypothetical protein
MSDENKTPESGLPHMPDAETIRQELGKAKNINDLTGKDGVFARLFGQTLTAMLEGELSGHLGYERGAYGDELVEAAARILRCHWQETGIAVVGVIPVPSLRRPALVPSFAQRLAAALGLPYATVIPHQSQHPPQHEMRNSFQQAVKLLGKYGCVSKIWKRRLESRKEKERNDG